MSIKMFLELILLVFFLNVVQTEHPVYWGNYIYYYQPTTGISSVDPACEQHYLDQQSRNSISIDQTTKPLFEAMADRMKSGCALYTQLDPNAQLTITFLPEEFLFDVEVTGGLPRQVNITYSFIMTSMDVDSLNNCMNWLATTLPVVPSGYEFARDIPGDGGNCDILAWEKMEDGLEGYRCLGNRFISPLDTNICLQVTYVELQKNGNTINTDNVEVNIGVATKFGCNIIPSTSWPPPTIIWYIGSEKKQKSATSTSYTVIASEADHNKENYCKAYNLQPESQAVESSKPKLYVRGIPFKPTAFRLKELRGSIAIFYWESGFNGGHKQIFLLQMRRDEEGRWRNSTIIKEHDMKSNLGNSSYIANISNLKPGTYDARLIAMNLIGAAEPVLLGTRFTVPSTATAEAEANNSVAAIVGGVSAGVLVIIGIVAAVFLIKYLRQKGFLAKKKNESLQQEHGPDYYNMSIKEKGKEVHTPGSTPNVHSLKTANDEDLSQIRGNSSAHDKIGASFHADHDSSLQQEHGPNYFNMSIKEKGKEVHTPGSTPNVHSLKTANYEDLSQIRGNPSAYDYLEASSHADHDSRNKESTYEGLKPNTTTEQTYASLKHGEQITSETTDTLYTNLKLN